MEYVEFLGRINCSAVYEKDKLAIARWNETNEYISMYLRNKAIR
jgi:hypothetical protein